MQTGSELGCYTCIVALTEAYIVTLTEALIGALTIRVHLSPLKSSYVEFEFSCSLCIYLYLLSFYCRVNMWKL